MSTRTLDRPTLDESTIKDLEERLKPQPPYAVVLHNDPFNGFEYVVKVLQKVLGYGQGKAFLLTLRAHCLGRSVVWTGALEVAELRAEQIVSCGPDPTRASAGARPLRVTVEPLTGGGE